MKKIDISFVIQIMKPDGNLAPSNPINNYEFKIKYVNNVTVTQVCSGNTTPNYGYP